MAQVSIFCFFRIKFNLIRLVHFKPLVCFLFVFMLISLRVYFPNRELYHVIHSSLCRKFRECLMGPTGTMGEGMNRSMDSGKKDNIFNWH